YNAATSGYAGVAHDAFRPSQEAAQDMVLNGITTDRLSDRRVLLSSLEGYAISAVRIGGVDHEFATIRGVVEDVVDIVLNLKQVRIKPVIQDEKGAAEKIYLTISGREEFRAGQIEEFTNMFKVMNPELLICRMEPSVTLEMEFTVTKGRGYQPADDGAPKDVAIGVIPIDAIYTPIKNVSYKVDIFMWCPMIFF
ncbi:MAG: hypothetical protein ACKOCH_04455, partial [Bacteroidota bacterium]